MPIVIAFRNENLKDNHWVEIKDLIGQEFDVDEDEFSLNSILNLNATQFKEEIQIIST
jgi:dynein heavy chain